jgi:type II restriction/modification system DNA methylase subunit YeeA
MKPEDFIKKWQGSTRKERSASQQHFLDLCEVLGVPKPGEPGSDPDDYDFEKSVLKLDGRPGRADVWKKCCFAWEYKGPRKSLTAAYSQLKEYADALENPPLLIVSDMQEIQVHTNFTNTVKETITIRLSDLTARRSRVRLRWAFTNPERLRPTRTPETITEDAAASIGALATKLRAKGFESRRVAHFLNKLVFCMFAEDIELLPDYVFTEVMEKAVHDPDAFVPTVGVLFKAMREKNGWFGAHSIPWFNGGLFDDDDVLPLGYSETRDVLAAARLDWSAVEPSIFGTLFERGLDPARRKEMASLFDARADAITTSVTRDLFAGETDKAVGIHYTDPEKIIKIVDPVVLRPLRDEWEAVKVRVAKHRAAKEKARTDSTRTKAEIATREAYLEFRHRLGRFRVLDPACGSGNFLYLALLYLKDFDLSVMKEADGMGLPPDGQRIGPDAVMGIEINPYAAELAQVTIWIGEIQWQLRNGFGITRSPILGRLASIACRDAVLNPDGTEAKWPVADVIVGNPPFLGGKRMIGTLGEEYVRRLFGAYKGRVPAEADLVCYWFKKAGEMISRGEAARAGLVATNSIRGGANRRALDSATNKLTIYEAWADEPWVIEGAAVRVSLVGFARSDDPVAPASRLDGEPVSEIYTDLTARRGETGVDLTKARRLPENRGIAFMGDTKGGAFDLPGKLAREWLELPVNPNGCPNADVLKPWMNGKDVTRRPSDTWIVDFGGEMSEAEAALYEAPFEYAAARVHPKRSKIRQDAERTYWWRHVRPRPHMRKTLEKLHRFIATPTVAKHRFFVFIPNGFLPDHQLIVSARDDDTTFGVLHSRFHELWALRKGTSLGDTPRYTPSTTFETFPFPEGLTPNIPAKDYADDPRAVRIAEAARRLNELRESWLNPPDLVQRVPEVVPGYPDRILPVSDKAATVLKKRTITNLYNERPAWLENVHRELDEAVAAAYGWEADITDDEVLARLLALNLERAKT